MQAPAGSGKTQLLTQRFLALLSVVEKPEEVLAITFTKAATAEMRNRVLDELRAAQALIDKDKEEQNEQTAELRKKHKHAIAALAQSRTLGWSLLERPQQLNIQTIDSLCLRIAYEAPLLSRLGGRLQPTEDVLPLYTLAARRTIERLGSGHGQLSSSLEQLLRLRDVNLGNCEELIADMLGNRDQWLEEFSGARSLTEAGWTELRERLEEPFRRERQETIKLLRGLLDQSPHSVAAMLQLLSLACTDSAWPEQIAGLSGLETLADCTDIEPLKCLCALLLTGGKTWRKRPTTDIGFKPLKDGGSRDHLNRFTAILAELSAIAGLQEALCRLKSLPDAAFSEVEWQTIRSIFTVLLHAAAELRVIFAERSLIDFVEAGITAEHALREPEVCRRWSTRVRHLLVDEFQDTSRRQYTLLKQIVSEWDASEQRTCFLVGDPMQSIYLFRYAELALFEEVKQHGFGTDLPFPHFAHLTLNCNFRSDAGIVEPINAMFDAAKQAAAMGAEHFTPALSKPDTPTTRALHLHTAFIEDGHDEMEAFQAEAAMATEIIRRHMPKLEQEKAAGRDFRIGVLVRNKQHVALIAAALRDASIPYRAVEIETLNERQEVRDLLSLMRALMHPFDRIAWLSVLRAPWCGLSLADLHILSGDDDQRAQKRPMRELLMKRIPLLSDDGQSRALRVHRALELALAQRFSGAFSASPQGFAAWIERTWIALGGPHCIDANARENVEAFFRLLAKLTPDGVEASGAVFDQRLTKLFAQPDPRAPERCSVQLMTIHKAKGLGFDVVLLPGLKRGNRRGDSPLLRWMQRTQLENGKRELLLAPIGAKGAGGSATYQWIGDQIKHGERAELQRLLYVATTRARNELHLFAALKRKGLGASGKVSAPDADTLLACGWRYLQTLVDEAGARLSSQAETPAPETPASDGLHIVPASPRHARGLDIAAGADKPTQQLKRLPSSWSSNRIASNAKTAISEETTSLHAKVEDAMQTRHGSLPTRARGIVLHALFESLASLPQQDPRRNIGSSLLHWQTITTALLQHAGLHGRERDAQRSTILAMLQGATEDADGQWILGRRPYARSESAWTLQPDGDIDLGGTLDTVRCDRAFLAGAEALSEGEDYLWIVDYKTADVEDSLLLNERAMYEPQLRRYADAFREATRCALPVRLALYYPALPRLLWWEA